MSLIEENMFSILTAIIVILAYLKIRKYYSYFKDRNIPYVKVRWIDVINCMSPRNFFNYPWQIYNEMKDKRPYVGIFHNIFMRSILIMDPSLVESILIKDFSSFHDHGYEQDYENNPMVKHLFNLKGDDWRILRYKLMPTFTSGKLKGMIPLLEECAENMINQVKQDPNLRQDVRMKDLFRRYSFLAIAKCVFGIDPEIINDPECQFQRAVKRLVYPTTFDKFKLLLSLITPWLSSTVKIKLYPQDLEDFLMNFTRDVIDMKRKSGVRRNDFMQLLLELKEKGFVHLESKDLEEDEKDKVLGIQSENDATKLEMTDELLMAQVFVFFIAGLDGTAFVSSCIAYALAKHPDIQKRVREEVIETKKKYGGMNYAALKEMKLLSACFDETMRLYFPIILARKCTKPFTFKDGTQFEVGTNIIIPSNGLHHDSKYWPNPDVFNPDRFLDKKKVHPGTFLPFGNGPRICIGKRFALMITELVIAMLLEHFEILPSPKNLEPIQVELLGTADFKGGTWATFKLLDKE